MYEQLKECLREIDKAIEEFKSKATNPENIYIDEQYVKLLMGRCSVVIALDRYE